jgi:hypothetical protein
VNTDCLNLTTGEAQTAQRLNELRDRVNIVRNCKPDDLPGKLGKKPEQAKEVLMKLVLNGHIGPRNNSASHYVMNPSFYPPQEAKSAREMWTDWLERRQQWISEKLKLKLETKGSLDAEEWEALKAVAPSLWETLWVTHSGSATNATIEQADPHLPAR